MDGLSNVASAVALVSLAIQLVDTVQEISKFLKNVQDAPKEVLRLIETLDQLQGTLDNVRQLIDQQFLVLRLPGSPTFITKAMENCEKQIKALETFASTARRSFEHQHRLRRTWASIRVVAKKHDIEDIQCRLRDAKMDLQFAVSSNSWHLQMFHIQNTVPVVGQILQAQSVSTLHSAPSRDEDEDCPGHEVSISCSTDSIKYHSSRSKQEYARWHSRTFGTLTLQKKSKYSQSPNASTERKAPLISETAWTFRPSFISYALQLRYARSFGYISRSLNFYPLLSHSDPVFEMCGNGDLLGLQVALSRKGVSPFMSDDWCGWTLLHHAAAYSQLEICDWLLQMGLGAETTDRNGNGRKALQIAGSCALRQDSVVNTFRVLAQHQDDVSASDICLALSEYSGPAEGMEVLLSHSSLHLQRFDITDDPCYRPPLAIALKCYSQNFLMDSTTSREVWRIPRSSCPRERKQWEPLIIRLIHQGADLHAPVFREGSLAHGYPYSPFHVSEYGTPLDSLFEISRTPDEARRLGAEWLGLLASKGHDVFSYLEKEKISHSSQHQITHPNSSNFYDLSPRELQFTFDDTQPCVWWEWWINPASHMDLLDHEFTQLVKHTSALPEGVDAAWRDMWPFYYPDWQWAIIFDRIWPGDYYGELAEHAIRRANRRLQKRYAKSTHPKCSRCPQMPGAWPEQS